MTADGSDSRYFLPARRALAEAVYDQVLVLLMDQEIKPGGRASIDGIARQLNVSPTPVREALVRLEAEGLVVSKPLKGYTAAPLLDAEGLRRLYEMRSLLEPTAAANAAERIGPEQLDELDQLAESVSGDIATAEVGDEHLQQYRDFAQRDAEFHRLIAAHSGNDLLAEAIARLRSHTHLYRIYFTTVINDDTAREHGAVVTALRAGDAAAAEAAMREHIAASYERMSAGFEPPLVE